GGIRADRSAGRGAGHHLVRGAGPGAPGTTRRRVYAGRSLGGDHAGDRPDSLPLRHPADAEGDLRSLYGRGIGTHPHLRPRRSGSSPQLGRRERMISPASFSQRRLWFIEQLEPPGTLYSLWVALRLRGALDRGALGRALTALVARHEALRTTF